MRIFKRIGIWRKSEADAYDFGVNESQTADAHMVQGEACFAHLTKVHELPGSNDCLKVI